MLKDLLESKKCFKLICGAGNEDLIEIERLVYVYAKAGCRFFDISANVDVLNAAKNGFEMANTGDKPYFCISFGIKGDPHTTKTFINENKCSKCNICTTICPQNAIENYCVKQERCIGCMKCISVCSCNAIGLKQEDVLPSLVLNNINHSDISCIELHANSVDNIDLLKKWNDIQSCFGGMLSICVDRSNLGNFQVLKRIRNMISDRKPFSTIIQADGIPMSGSNDDYKTTLQAVAMAEIIQNAELPVYVLISGGTNSKTAELAKLCNIYANGVSIGSYARKIVKNYINKEDFYSDINSVNSAIDIAKKLINDTIKYLG